MKKIVKSLLFLFSLTGNTLLFAQVPQIGKSNTLEIASWNIEWFGSTQYGPSNENLQYSNVKNILLESNIDIWALQEICDTAKMKKFLDETGVYSGFFSTYWQTQKTGLIWRKSQFNLISANPILQIYSADFANGRLPLEVVLCTKNLLDTFTFLVIHLKAQTGNPQEMQLAWENRKKSAERLSDYLQARQDRKVAVIGDWNDDIDKSIYRDTISPFLNLFQNPELHFLLESQSFSGEHSYIFGEGMIDHIMLNDRAYNQYLAGESEIFYLQNAVSGYSTTTSDHYPVYAKFSFTQPTHLLSTHKNDKFKIWPNPVTNGRVMVGFEGEKGHWQLKDMYSRIVSEGELNEKNKEIFIAEAGHYILVININNNVYYERLVVKG